MATPESDMVDHLRTVLGADGTAPVDNPWDAEARDIPLRAIDVHTDNVRRTMDPVELEQLKASLQQYGMLEPVLVQPIPGKRAGHRYRLVAGFRRLTAAKALGWDLVPARVLARPLSGRERVAVQLTENLQRESMRIRDIVTSVQLLQQDGLPVARIAEELGLGVSTVRLYVQLGEVLTKYPKLWPYFDRGLISIEHFRAASRLLTRIRERAGSRIQDPAQLELIRAEAEHLFVQLLDRLAQIQPLTVRRVSQEVAQWLAKIGIDEAPAKAAAAPQRWKAVLASLQTLDWSTLSSEELEAAITATETALDAAKARLAELASQG